MSIQQEDSSDAPTFLKELHLSLNNAENCKITSLLATLSVLICHSNPYSKKCLCLIGSNACMKRMNKNSTDSPHMIISHVPDQDKLSSLSLINHYHFLIIIMFFPFHFSEMRTTDSTNRKKITDLLIAAIKRSITDINICAKQSKAVGSSNKQHKKKHVVTLFLLRV